jgi:hypothetical protein
MNRTLFTYDDIQFGLFNGAGGVGGPGSGTDGSVDNGDSYGELLDDKADNADTPNDPVADPDVDPTEPAAPEDDGIAEEDGQTEDSTPDPDDPDGDLDFTPEDYEYSGDTDYATQLGDKAQNAEQSKVLAEDMKFYEQVAQTVDKGTPVEVEQAMQTLEEATDEAVQEADEAMEQAKDKELTKEQKKDLEFKQNRAKLYINFSKQIAKKAKSRASKMMQGEKDTVKKKQWDKVYSRAMRMQKKYQLVSAKLVFKSKHDGFQTAKENAAQKLAKFLGFKSAKGSSSASQALMDSTTEEGDVDPKKNAKIAQQVEDEGVAGDGKHSKKAGKKYAATRNARQQRNAPELGKDGKPKTVKEMEHERAVLAKKKGEQVTPEKDAKETKAPDRATLIAAHQSVAREILGKEMTPELEAQIEQQVDLIMAGGAGMQSLGKKQNPSSLLADVHHQATGLNRERTVKGWRSFEDGTAHQGGDLTDVAAARSDSDETVEGDGAALARSGAEVSTTAHDAVHPANMSQAERDHAARTLAYNRMSSGHAAGAPFASLLHEQGFYVQHYIPGQIRSVDEAIASGKTIPAARIQRGGVDEVIG